MEGMTIGIDMVVLTVFVSAANLHAIGSWSRSKVKVVEVKETPCRFGDGRKMDVGCTGGGVGGRGRPGDPSTGSPKGQDS